MAVKLLCFLAFAIIAVCDGGLKNDPEVVRKHGYAKRYGYGYTPRHGPGLGYGYGFGHAHLYEHGYKNHLAYFRNDGQPQLVRELGYSEQYGYGYGPRYGPVHGPEYGPGYRHGHGHGNGHGHVYGPIYGHGYGPRYGHGIGYGHGYRHGYGHGHGYRHQYGHGYRHGYGHGHVNYYAYPRYNFGYKVVDHHTGDIKEQQEHRDGDVVRGYYALHQPDGAERTVRYYADDHVGFQADVKYGIHHLYPRYIT